MGVLAPVQLSINITKAKPLTFQTSQNKTNIKSMILYLQMFNKFISCKVLEQNVPLLVICYL
jgi:hypothetical protein